MREIGHRRSRDAQRNVTLRGKDRLLSAGAALMHRCEQRIAAIGKRRVDGAERIADERRFGEIEAAVQQRRRDGDDSKPTFHLPTPSMVS